MINNFDSMITFKSLWKDYTQNSNFKDCFYHDKAQCTGQIKKAHSIQKERILSQIEYPVKGNNLIYSLNDYKDEDFRIKELIPIGKNKASIFTGFCDYHDSKLFSPIENFPFIATPEQLFLLTYRAFAHGFHQLMERYTYYISRGKYLKYFPRDYVQEHINLVVYRMWKYKKYRKILNSVIEEKTYDKINYHYRIFKPFVPLASASILSPLYTYKNIFLNPREEYSCLVLNIIPDTTQTIVCISQFEEDYKGKIFFKELEMLSNDEFKEAISSLLIYCTSNTFFSPILWEKFSSIEKQQLPFEIDYCTHKGGQIDKFFLSKINFFKE